MEPHAENSLSQALLATAGEPLAILNGEMRVVAASRSYCRMFPPGLTGALEDPFCRLNAPRWGSAASLLLQDVLKHDFPVVDKEIELEIPNLGRRHILLNARRIKDATNRDAVMLIALEDLTTKHEAERLRAELTEEHDMLLLEVHHRVANSLQIIASILMLKARMVQSEETRTHLRDVHHRLLSVATVQRQLSVSRDGGDIELGFYLASLCKSLTGSMIDDVRRISITASVSPGSIRAQDAVSVGLIVTELVINSLKHGFPDGGSGRIEIDFERKGLAWRLTVRDDGVGRKIGAAGESHTGLGTSLVEALARSLQARVEIGTPARGSETAIIHAG